MHDFISRLPKVELHVHLVGSASPGTVLELARRHPQHGVPAEAAALKRFYEFTDFAHFIDVYVKVNHLVASGADVTMLVVGLAADLARNNVRYAEVTVTPASHLQRGIAPDELTEALRLGRERALTEHGVRLAWIFDVPGPMDPTGQVTLDYALREHPEGTVGFGLGGPEIGVPREQFRDAFRRAGAAGLRLVPHAGETTGPESVWAALRELGAERIGHGTNAARDPRLLEHLAQHGIALEVCPTSNVCTGAVPSLAEHPLPAFLAAGAPVTLATDDPGMFHTDLNREYLLCHSQFGLDAADLAELARAGVRAAFCPPEVRAALLAEIDAVAAQAHGAG